LEVKEQACTENMLQQRKRMGLRIAAMLGLTSLALAGCASSSNEKPGSVTTGSSRGEIHDSALERLQGQPVSMLDFGMELMWRDLEQTARDKDAYFGRNGAFPAAISVTYDGRENKIWIDVRSDPGTERTVMPGNAARPSPEAWCKTLVLKLRAELGGGDVTQVRNFPPRWLRYFVHGFGHSSFVEPGIMNTKEVQQLEAALPQLVFLRAHTFEYLESQRGLPVTQSLTCIGPLLDGDISVERGTPTESVE
jgi:hypothetical protein